MADAELCDLCKRQIGDDGGKLTLSVSTWRSSNGVHRFWGSGSVTGQASLCLDCAFALDTVAADAIRAKLEAARDD